jgi:enoyl-CoA hydratase/carnithine racemase
MPYTLGVTPHVEGASTRNRGGSGRLDVEGGQEGRLAPALLTEREGRVLTVRLHKPPRNMLDAGVYEELHALVRSVERDRSVRALVVTGGLPGQFCSGYDGHELLEQAQATSYTPTYRQARALLAAFGALVRVPGAAAALARTPLGGIVSLLRADDALMRLSRLDKPVIAAIDGVALGGGLSVALACDIRLMSDTDSAVGLMESNIGFMAGSGATQRLTRLAGASRAIELLLEGRVLGPEEALAAGLVHRLVPPGELLPQAHELAERLARRPAHIVRELKRAVYDGGTRRLAAGIRVEQASLVATASRPESIRGIEAYHGEIEPLEALTNEKLLAALQRLRDGRVVDLST